MIDAKPYVQGDVFSVKPRDVFNDQDSFAFEDFLGCDSKNFTKSIYRNERIIAVIGVVPTGRGHADVWSVMSDEVKEEPIRFYRLVKNNLFNIRRVMGFHRMQSFIRSDCVVSKRWIKSLGFNYEGTLRKFGLQKDDYDVWAMVE